MIGLFDLDSLLYKAVHKCVTVSEIKEQLAKIDLTKNVKLQKTNIREWITENSFNKLEQKMYKILEDANNLGINTNQVELYISFCPLSERKRIEPTYKSNRVRNLWVERLKLYIAEKSNIEVKYNLKWEADDLIANRAKQLRNEEKEYVIFAIDKDLRQIEGVHFNYDMTKIKGDFIGEISNEDYLPNRLEIQREYLVEKTKTSRLIYKCHYDYKGIEIVTKEVARELFLKQLIMGDSTDNIKGIPKMGEVKASKIINENKTDFSRRKAILKAYQDYYGETAKKEYRKTALLVKIGQ